jgi:hypothetical protein
MAGGRGRRKTAALAGHIVGVYPRAMELLVVGLVWVLLGGLVMGGAAVVLEYQASGSLMDQILDGIRQVLPKSNR